MARSFVYLLLTFAWLNLGVVDANQGIEGSHFFHGQLVVTDNAADGEDSNDYLPKYGITFLSPALPKRLPAAKSYFISQFPDQVRIRAPPVSS